MTYMKKKDLYTSPQAEVLEMSYADPVCQALSNGVPDYDYDPLDPDYLFN